MKTMKPKQITTESGFSFTPPEHLFDNWDFLSVTGRLASSKLTEAETVAAYFEAVDLLMPADDLERLKAHVREKKGYASFAAMRAEIEEMLSKLKEVEGNSSSSPE